MKTYKGTYKIKNRSKYKGNPNNVVYRSGWELNVMNWCDRSPQVKEWASEEIIIPYVCATDKRSHRYFIDFYIKYDNGREVLVEVKPFKETRPPKKAGRGTSRQRVLTEGLTYIKNTSKWKAAKEFCSDRGWHFEIWTENELRAMGILPKQFKPMKKLQPYKKPKKKV